MARRVCILLLLMPAAAAGLTQAARANPVSSCDNPADSALSQYCETIPSTGGGQRPSTGTPALGSSLPAPIVHQIVTPAGRKARHRRLLTIPAPAKTVSVGSTNQTVASTQGLSTWMIVILIALALALASGALLDRRRRRARPG